VRKRDRDRERDPRKVFTLFWFLKHKKLFFASKSIFFPVALRIEKFLGK
jgi:hypothetical protein